MQLSDVEQPRKAVVFKLVVGPQAVGVHLSLLGAHVVGGVLSHFLELNTHLQILVSQSRALRLQRLIFLREQIDLLFLGLDNALDFLEALSRLFLHLGEILVAV